MEFTTLAETLWQRCLTHIETRLPEKDVNLWLRPLEADFNEGGLDTGIDMARLLDVADRIAALPGGVVGSPLRNVPRERAA